MLLHWRLLDGWSGGPGRAAVPAGTLEQFFPLVTALTSGKHLGSTKGVFMYR
ncbi:hypothetical protein [Arthrobacter sp. DR-2P]|nr:hypothetical protein [Arthrobacter sp. DR-2P]